ncbi:MAG: hypothetical protein AAEJ04_04895 [Planctomycetota bacterium]
MFRFLIVLVVFIAMTSVPVLALADGHVEIDADLRLRWEYSSPWNPGDSGDTVTLMRTHVGMNTDFSDNIHFMLDVHDARSLSGQDSSDDPTIGDGGPEIHQVHVQLDDLSRFHSSLSFLSGWSLGLGRSEVPNYDKGRIVQSADWSNTGPTTSDGYHLANQFLDGALDLNIHYMTLAKDINGGAGSGDYFYGAHIGVDSLPFIEASFYYWKSRADLLNTEAAAAGGNPDPGRSSEDTYGYFFSLREGIIPRVGLTFEYALQDGFRYDVDSIKKLDSLYFAIEGTYDMPQVAGFWDLDLYGGHIMATGTSTGASRVEAFRSAFGTPHGMHGIADVVGNSNVRDTYFGFGTMLAGADVAVTYHNLRADQGEDWGNEFDIVVQHPLGELLDLEVGVAKFTTNTSLRENTDFLYAQTHWQF